MNPEEKSPPTSHSPLETSLNLLQRVRGKDPDAWQRLVRLYTPLVNYWCGRWGCEPSSRDDVVQDVFLAVSRHLHQFRKDRPGDTFRGWLRVVARNSFLMQLRREDRQPLGEGGTDNQIRIQQLIESGTDEEEDAPNEINVLYQRALELVRSEFEGRTWQMFWFAVVDGRTPADIAEAMSVSPAAVRQAKSRVLRRLKEEMGDVIS